MEMTYSMKILERILQKNVSKIRDEIHKKIMKALIQVYGEEEANKINEEWIGCSSEIEIENEIVIFKEALYLGYDLADVFFNRR